MVERKIKPILFVMLATPLLTACPPTYDVSIYNNSGESVYIDGRNIIESEWKNGEYINPRSLGPFRSMRNGSLSSDPTLKLHLEDGNYHCYFMPPYFVLGREWYEIKPSSWLMVEHSRYRAQLESDGTIYVVPPGIIIPANNLSLQPEGFPIHPTVC